MSSSESGNNESLEPQEVDIRIQAQAAADYHRVSVGVILAMFKEGIFTSITYVKNGQHTPLFSEVRSLATHPRIVEGQQNRQRFKTGRVRVAGGKREALQLADVVALVQEHHRMLTQMGVTVTYHDYANQPEDAVGENGYRPGQDCPGYKKAPGCGGKLRLRWSGQPDDRETALHGWFIGCDGWRYDHSGCEFCETIVRSKTSALVAVPSLPRLTASAAVVPVAVIPIPHTDTPAAPAATPPDNSGPTVGG